MVVHTEQCNCDESERRTLAEGAARQTVPPAVEFARKYMAAGQTNSAPKISYKPEKRHEAIIQISQERIRALLDIPSNWQIVDVEFDKFRGTFLILFSGDDLYPLYEGCAPPVIAASYNLPDLRPEYAEGNP